MVPNLVKHLIYFNVFFHYSAENVARILEITEINTQLTFTYSKSTIETLKKV